MLFCSWKYETCGSSDCCIHDDDWMEFKYFRLSELDWRCSRLHSGRVSSLVTLGFYKLSVNDSQWAAGHSSVYRGSRWLQILACSHFLYCNIHHSFGHDVEWLTHICRISIRGYSCVLQGLPQGYRWKFRLLWWKVLLLWTRTSKRLIYKTTKLSLHLHLDKANLFYTNHPCETY